MTNNIILWPEVTNFYVKVIATAVQAFVVVSDCSEILEKIKIKKIIYIIIIYYYTREYYCFYYHDTSRAVLAHFGTAITCDGDGT